MAEGRFDEALVILKQGAKANGKTLPPDSVLYEMIDKFKNQVLWLTSVATLTQVTKYKHHDVHVSKSPTFCKQTSHPQLFGK